MTPVRVAIFASLCFALCLAVLQPGKQGGALSRVEGQMLDIRFALRGEIAPPRDIVILAIDDAALAQAFPLPRIALAEAITLATKGGARAVVLDLLLTGPMQDDGALVAALTATEAVALAISLMETAPVAAPHLIEQLEQSSFDTIRNSIPTGPGGVLGPQVEFAAQAGLGHVNLRLDDDGMLRRFPVALRLGDGPVLPALAVLAARFQAGSGREALSLVSGEALGLGGHHIPLDRENMAALNYYGPRGTIQTLPIMQAVHADLAGKLVFIGATAEGYRDAFGTPFDAALPGVEAVATLAANILGETVLRRDRTTWVLDVALAVVCAVFAALVASRARPLVAVMGSVGVWVMGLAVLQLGFLGQLWLDAATLLSALTVGTLLGFAARWETNRRRARNLSRYQSPQLVEALASQTTPEFDGRMQRAAILFVDLADFTRHSAEIGSKDTSKLLNRFHTLVNRSAEHWGGVVAYTAGDGAMIVFGLPKVSADDAKHALGCAGELLAEINSDILINAVSHPTPVRIGAHSGDVFAVVLGEHGRSTPTVTGDVVNTASRLQDYAKTQGAVLAMSDAVFEEAGQPDLRGLRHASSVTLRGRAQGLDLWLMLPEQRA